MGHKPLQICHLSSRRQQIHSTVDVMSLIISCVRMRKAFLVSLSWIYYSREFRRTLQMILSWLSSTIGIKSRAFEIKYSVIISWTNPDMLRVVHAPIRRCSIVSISPHRSQQGSVIIQDLNAFLFIHTVHKLFIYLYIPLVQLLSVFSHSFFFLCLSPLLK